MIGQIENPDQKAYQLGNKRISPHQSFIGLGQLPRVTDNLLGVHADDYGNTEFKSQRNRSIFSYLRVRSEINCSDLSSMRSEYGAKIEKNIEAYQVYDEKFFD